MAIVTTGIFVMILHSEVDLSACGSDRSLQAFETIVLQDGQIQIFVEARDLPLKRNHESEEDERFEQVAQTHRVLPDGDVELVWLGLVLALSRPVEALPQLVILLVVKLVREGQVVGRCQVENGAANICLTFPHAADYAIDVVYLQEAVHFEPGHVLQHCHAIDVLLRQQRFDLVWIVVVLVDHDKLFLDRIVHEVDPEGQTAELFAHLEQDVRCEHEPHERVACAHDVAIGLESLRLRVL